MFLYEGGNDKLGEILHYVQNDKHRFFAALIMARMRSTDSSVASLLQNDKSKRSE